MQIKRLYAYLIAICFIIGSFTLNGCDSNQKEANASFGRDDPAPTAESASVAATTAGNSSSATTTSKAAAESTAATTTTGKTTSATTTTGKTATTTAAAAATSTTALAAAPANKSNAPVEAPAKDPPRASLRLSRNQYPKVDGSTATIPLAVMLARAVTGMSLSEAEIIAAHTKTSMSFHNLVNRYADLLLVYAPQESLFDDLKQYSGVDKSSLIMEPIGRDALIFLVNENNPVKSLTHGQIIDIYTGKTDKWSELINSNATSGGSAGGGSASNGSAGGGSTGGGSASGSSAKTAFDDKIVAYQRVKSSGSQVMMDNLVMDGIKMAEAPQDKIIAEMGQLIDSVAEYSNSGNAIGYSVYYYFSRMYNLEGVRALDVGGIPCDNGTIREGSYPFIQDFYAVIRRDEPQGSATRRLFDFITGDEGQALVDLAGYVSIRGGGPAPEAFDGRIADGSWKSGVSGLRTADAKNPNSDAGEDPNVFPLTVAGKTGFINANGEPLCEPTYDAAHPLTLFDGGIQPYSFNGNHYPIYYNAIIYERDENGVPDREKPASTDVIGPSGRILYSMDEPETDVYYINIIDGSLCGYRGYDIRKQFFRFLDGTELVLDQNAYLTCEIYGGNRRIRSDGDNNAYITDLHGNPVSDKTYGEFAGYANGLFMFRTDEHITAVNGEGDIIREFPDGIFSLIYDKFSGMYIYMKTNPTDKKVSYLMSGLMDKDFNVVTDAEWENIYPTRSGKAFITSTYVNNKDIWESFATLIDGTGKTLSERAYESITNMMDVNNSATPASDGNDYFLACRKRDDKSDNIYVNDIIDSRGNILFSDSEQMTVETVFGDYAILRVLPSNERPYAGYVGLKRISDGNDLANPDDGWLVNPNYNYGWPDSGTYIRLFRDPARFPIADNLADNTIMYDILKKTAMAVGNYQVFKFCGFADAGLGGGGGGGADAYAGGTGVFYVETSTRKGYIDDRGKWIVSLSKFDALGMDD